MKLFILQPKPNLPKGDNPWDPWFDKSFGFIIIAETEDEAREIATANCDPEEYLKYYLSEKVSDTTTPWIDEKYSTCEELLNDRDKGIIMVDFRSA